MVYTVFKAPGVVTVPAPNTVQFEENPFETVPLRSIVAILEHKVSTEVIFTSGLSNIVTRRLSDTATQLLLLVDVRVIVNEPVAVSAELIR